MKKSLVVSLIVTVISALLFASCNNSTTVPTPAETMGSFGVKTEPIGVDVYLLDPAGDDILLGTTSDEFIIITLPVGQ